MTKKRIRWGIKVPPSTFAIGKSRPPKLFLDSDGYVVATTTIKPKHSLLVDAMKKKVRRKRVGRKEKRRR
jgi:hypothetical protein